MKRPGELTYMDSVEDRNTINSHWTNARIDGQLFHLYTSFRTRFVLAGLRNKHDERFFIADTVTLLKFLKEKSTSELSAIQPFVKSAREDLEKHFAERTKTINI